MSNRLPPDEIERLIERARERGIPVPTCACGCGTPLIGRRSQTKWASDACRMRAKRR